MKKYFFRISIIEKSFKRFYSSSVSTIPSFVNIDKKWSKLKELEQADIMDDLNMKSQGNWKNLTLDEKKALYYIYYGEWGPRSTKSQKSISLTILKSLFSFVLLIGSGVGLYNYAIDQEHKERLENTIKKVQKIKEKEAKEAEIRKSIDKPKKNWFWW